MAHSASSDITSAGLRGKFGPELQYIMQHTACSRQRRDMWVGSFFLVWNASSPIIIKKNLKCIFIFSQILLQVPLKLGELNNNKKSPPSLPLPLATFLYFYIPVINKQNGFPNQSGKRCPKRSGINRTGLKSKLSHTEAGVVDFTHCEVSCGRLWHF